jgi:hypothetical protein
MILGAIVQDLIDPKTPRILADVFFANAKKVIVTK